MYKYQSRSYKFKSTSSLVRTCLQVDDANNMLFSLIYLIPYTLYLIPYTLYLIPYTLLVKPESKSTSCLVRHYMQVDDANTVA